MGVITYTAKRNLIAGHTATTEYQIETAFQVVDPFDKETGSQEESLGGDVEYELDRLVGFYRLKSDVVTDANKLLWREFFSSVAAREVFEVDLTGTIAAPGTDLSCKLHRGGYQPLREGNDSFTFSFEIRLLP